MRPMRRALGTIEDIGDGRFRVRLSEGYSRKTSGRIRPSVTVRGNQREAERTLATLATRAGKLSPEKMTVETYLTDVWLPTKDGRRRKTRLGYASKIRSCIVPYLGTLQVKAVDAYAIERWMVDLQRDGKSPQTIVNARGVLKNAMRAAVRWRLIDRDPTEGTERPRVNYEPKVLSGEQMGEYLDAFVDHPIEPLVVLAIAGGFRRSELCGLEWSDVDFAEGTVNVRRGMHQYGADVWFEDTKSLTSRRTISIPEWALARLRALRGVGALVVDGAGPIKPDAVSNLYDAHVADKNLPRVPLRDLRNSHGTFLHDAGVPLEFIADRLGHSDTAITRKHYVARSHANAERVSVAALTAIGAAHLGPTGRESTPQGPQERDSDRQGIDTTSQDVAI